MGNRGTTPDDDDARIIQLGLPEFVRQVTAPARRAATEKRAQQVKAYLDDVLALMPGASEEEVARVKVAIPEVANTLPVANMVIRDWPEVVARKIYLDWQHRTGHKYESEHFFHELSPREQEPFLKIVEVVIKALEGKTPPGAPR